MPHHSTPIDEIYQKLNSSSIGLSQEEADIRLKKFGSNELPSGQKEHPLLALLKSFISPLSIILLAAALTNLAYGLFFTHASEDFIQSLLVLAIVVGMNILSFVIDHQSNKALSKLNDLQKTFCLVSRDGKTTSLPSENLVLGDVIFLGEGNKIPADCRLISSHVLEVNQATLTGESVPQAKKADNLPDNTPTNNQTNMLFSGTYVSGGSCVAIVVGTGLQTEIGKVWFEISQTPQGKTPLQKQLDNLGVKLLWGTITICLAILAIFALRGQPLHQAVIVGISLAIAFVPEALSAVITLALAVGKKEMVGHQAIIRRIIATEALGSVDTICTDKTGTITEGEMTVKFLWTKGLGLLDSAKTVNEENKDLWKMIHIVAYCNNQQNTFEKALMTWVNKFNFSPAPNYQQNRLHEVPFNSQRKIMSTVQKVENETVLYSKGALLPILDKCTNLMQATRTVKLSEKIRQEIISVSENLQSQGFSVMATAFKNLATENYSEKLETDLTFVGLIALYDPPKMEVAPTIEALRKAGIRPIMITGDSQRTAHYIAQAVGLIDEKSSLDEVITAEKLNDWEKRGFEDLHPEEISQIANCSVFAQTSPTDKVFIMECLQKMGHLVGMTGDGVNDAPVLKKANVGIAVFGATDIARECADVALLSGYHAIAGAVEVGRNILYRTKLYIHALLSTNLSEVFIFIVAVLFGWPTPFTALQLLTINVFGDSFLSMSLAFEKTEKKLMEDPPRKASEPIITQPMYLSILLQGIVTTAILCFAFLQVQRYAQIQNWTQTQTLSTSQSVLFILFMIQKILRTAFTSRSLKFNLWQIGFFSNPHSLVSALGASLLTITALNVPFLGMHFLPIGLLPLILLGLIPPVFEEAFKLIRRQIK